MRREINKCRFLVVSQAHDLTRFPGDRWGSCSLEGRTAALQRRIFSPISLSRIAASIPLPTAAGLTSV